MKRRNIFFIVFILIALVAVFTKPGQEDFKKFIRTQSEMPPSIEYTNGFAYSLYNVTYYETQQPPAENRNEKNSVVAPGKKATYLGLFGKFWKL